MLTLTDIHKKFGNNEVLKGVTLDVGEGTVVVILGPSGSGKTTLLRCLNFLEQPDAGRIVVNGEVLFDALDPATKLEANLRHKRLHFGLVFQSFHLFPQYTAMRNITLAMELHA